MVSAMAAVLEISASVMVRPAILAAVTAPPASCSLPTAPMLMEETMTSAPR
ncbi:hypothetical protein D3C83_291670 [compost metagenome]